MTEPTDERDGLGATLGGGLLAAAGLLVGLLIGDDIGKTVARGCAILLVFCLVVAGARLVRRDRT